jgi:hypothetical protein
MTERDRAVMQTAIRAERTIRREAAMNSEQPSKASSRRVRSIVEDVAHNIPAANAIGERGGRAWARFRNEVTRRIEDACDVRRGWWSS